MAVTPAQKLTQTVLKIARYMKTEWEMSPEETVGPEPSSCQAFFWGGEGGGGSQA